MPASRERSGLTEALSSLTSSGFVASGNERVGRLSIRWKARYRRCRLRLRRFLRRPLCRAKRIMVLLF